MYILLCTGVKVCARGFVRQVVCGRENCRRIIYLYVKHILRSLLNVGLRLDFFLSHGKYLYICIPVRSHCCSARLCFFCSAFIRFIAFVIHVLSTINFIYILFIHILVTVHRLCFIVFFYPLLVYTLFTCHILYVNTHRYIHHANYIRILHFTCYTRTFKVGV